MKSVVKYITLCTVVLWWGCDRVEIPPVISTDPVFTFAGTVNEAPLAFTAGDDGVYMFTGYEVDTAQVLRFYGEFAQENTNLVDRSALRIELRNFTQGSFVGNDYDSVFQLGPRLYLEPIATPQPAYYVAHLTPITLGQVNTLTWTLDNQPINISGTEPFDLALPIGFHTLQVASEQDTLCGLTSFRTDFLLKPDSTDNFVLNVSFNPSVGLTASALVTSDSTITYTWGANGMIVTDSTLSLQSYDGQYCVTATNAQSDTAVACINFYGANNPSQPFCLTAFTSEVHYVPGVSEGDPQFGRIVVQFTDIQGVTWRSDRASQPLTSSFMLLEATPYERNELGQATYKLRANINCTLYNGNGESRILTGEQTVFAVGVPD